MFPVGMKMTSPSARFPQSGSFTAGLLIGWSIAAAALALTETTSVAWQARLVFGAPALLAALALLACYVPARQSARLDPAAALKAE